jgi:predicted P-loop ATPase
LARKPNIDKLIQELEEAEANGITPETLPLDRNKRGVPYLTLHNLEIIINSMYQFKGLAFNEFTQEVEIKQHPLEESFIDEVRLDIDTVHQATYRKNDIYSVVNTLARRNSYHPVKAMIEATPWDGTPRAETIFIDYLGAENNDYSRTVARKWLAGAVARIYNPGVKFDLVPILQGKQGIGKSSLANKLACGFFVDSLKSMGQTKDDYQLLIGAWIVELGELSSMRATQTEQIKNYISARVDKVRLPYERNTRELKRTTVFIGTTNDTSYLNDLTGNRRFLPLPLKEIPAKTWQSLDKATVQQIWAEAKTWFDNDEVLYLSPEMEEKAEVYRSDALEQSLGAEQVEEFLNMEVPINWEELDLYDKQQYYNVMMKHGEVTNTTYKNERKPLDRTTKRDILGVVFNVDASDRREYSIGKKVRLIMDNHKEWANQTIRINGKPVKGYKKSDKHIIS